MTSEFIAMFAFTAVVLGAAAFLFWCVVQMERDERRRP